MTNNNSPNVDYNYWHQKTYQIDLLGSLRSNKMLYELIIHQLRLSAEDRRKKLLDVACGKGVFLREVNDRNLGLDLYGLDISDVAITKAEEFVEANFVVGDAQNMPYENNIFDYITCSGGLEYYPDPKKGAREMYRVLKKGGLACILVPNLMFIGHIYMAWRYGVMPSEGGQSGVDRFYDYEIEKFYTCEGWERILRSTGLEVLNCKKYNFILGSKKVSDLVRFLYNRFFQYFVPLNLSYCFVFLCRKK